MFLIDTLAIVIIWGVIGHYIDPKIRAIKRHEREFRKRCPKFGPDDPFTTDYYRGPYA